MSQSSSRVKLNRVALKDVVGVKVAPRRRKVPLSSTDSTTEEDQSMLENSGWNKPPRENGRASSARQEKRVGMHVETVRPHPKERRLQTSPKTTDMPRKTKVVVAAPLASRKSSKRCDLCNGRSVSGARGRQEPRARKARSARRLPPRASAAPRPPPSNNNRTNSPGPAELESSVRRSNGSFDAVCQESKHSPHPWRKDSRRGGKRLSSDLVQGKPKSKKTTRSEETELWMNPRVVLCDIAKSCSACRHGCGLILPNALVSKAMRCFKQAMLTGQQFWPGCVFHSKQTRRDQTEPRGAQVKSEPVCEENQDESFTCQRVSMYTRKVPYSCARTNIPWPFGKGHLSSCGALAASSLEGVDLSGSDSVTENPNQAGSLSSFALGNLDSCHPSRSSLPFPQDEDQIIKSLPGKPLSNENRIHLKSSFLCGFLKAGCMKTDTNRFILPTLLSPVASPHNPDQSSSSSDEEEQTKAQQSSPERHRLQNRTEERGLKSSVWSDEEEPEGKEDECDEHEQAVGLADEDASRSKTKSPAKSPGSPVQTQTPPRSGEEDLPVLDEITAYEHDILLVDVVQNDPELFVEPPNKSVLRLGPKRGSKAPNKTAPAAVRVTFAVGGAPGNTAQSLTSMKEEFCCDGQDAAAESASRPWRPRCSSTLPNLQNASPAPQEHSRHVAQCDTNNNHVDSVFKRIQPIQTVSSSLLSAGADPWIKNAVGGSDFRRQKSNSYCRQYFSESLTCGFKMCRFQHLPVEGDEKFCVETVMRFIKNPACLQKAGVVFTGYYNSSPPGVYFSMPLLLSLLWALLKAGMVSDVLSVLRVTLTHNIVPSHEFLLDLFNFVREKSLTGFVPELMNLTFKMASVGLDLSLDCLDCVKNMPLFQQTGHPCSPAAASQKSQISSRLSPSPPLPDYLNLAHAVVEVELCTKQEDWKRMGKVFCSICQSSYHPSQVESVSGRIAIALLSESKDKLSLPFSAFVETVFQREGEGSLVRNFVGRIGVSLMLRYHKTHQWLKGRAVVEIMSAWKVGYTTMKGLFGNEDCASRCSLVTVATELFLLSGSAEGALNTLRENAWFLSSSSWPCDPADLENRARVLKHLAEKTSQRETLEILQNMPDVSKSTSMFNSHLQACVDRQILPVASDTVDFMLSNKLAVDHTLLQTLLHKLGKAEPLAASTGSLQALPESGPVPRGVRPA
ncbi:hypothetical protein OJAV_G00106800 [Oryzias javanicus]|uniref:Protein TOPAZ1 n=1 Tax=Oryzias javanicus TaxID=123683 RepID=A0A3S2MTE2_ORYJA|nr:hypothetical protein OJAV_G00106800 [Oryzias javanicus]